MTDREKPRRPSSHWDATKRDLVGREHRRTPVRGVEITHADEPTDDDHVELSLDPELERSLNRDVVSQLRELVDDLTPPPIDTNKFPRDPTAAESWQHATNVNQRVVNLLAQIAHSSGAGMLVGDEIAKLRRGRRLSIGISIGSLVSVIATLIAVGTKLYGRGYDAGVDASWKAYIERAVDKNSEHIERLESHRYRPDPDPAPKVTP